MLGSSIGGRPSIIRFAGCAKIGLGGAEDGTCASARVLVVEGFTLVLRALLRMIAGALLAGVAVILAPNVGFDGDVLSDVFCTCFIVSPVASDRAA